MSDYGEGFGEVLVIILLALAAKFFFIVVPIVIVLWLITKVLLWLGLGGILSVIGLGFLLSWFG